MGWLGAQTAAIQPPKLGAGLNGVAYYTNDFPFLNELKHASGQGSGFNGAGFQCITSGGDLFPSFEEGYIPWDSDGYPTSLTCNPIPSGGQQTVAVILFLYVNTVKPAGASNFFPQGQRTVLFDGAGTIQITGAATATITSSGQTFTPSDSSIGLHLKITQTDPSSTGNYIRNLRVVRTAQLASFNAGQIFSPEYLAALSNGFHVFRFMDNLQTNGEWGAAGGASQSQGTCFTTYNATTITAGSTSAVLGCDITFSSTPSMGATSATVSSFAGNSVGVTWPFAGMNNLQVTFSDGETRTVTVAAQGTTLTWTGGLSSNVTTAAQMQIPWNWPSQTVTTLFRQGDVRQVQYTIGSPNVTWTGGLSRDCTYNGHYDPMLNISWKNFSSGVNGWGSRSLLSNATYITQKGFPWEICIALGNACATGLWLNIPLAYSESDVVNLLKLIDSTLTNTLPVYLESSNEVWNTVFRSYSAASFYGYGMWPSQIGGGLDALSRNWYGMRCARVAQLAHDNMTTFGRCYPIISAQTAVQSTAVPVLNTPLWAQGPAYNYPLKCFAVTYYYGGAPSSADITTMVGQGDGGYTDFFATLYAQGSYSSVPSGGWINSTLTTTTGWVSYLNANYPKLSLVAYEGGFSFTGNNNSGVTGATATAWTSLVEGSTYDSRILTATQTLLTNWQENVGSGNLVNQFVGGFNSNSGTGCWSAAESVLQTLTPPSSAPYKWRGMMNYLGKWD